MWPLTALSAVLNGALIDRAKLIRLRQMLDCRELELHGSDGDEHAFIEFLMPFDGLGNHHLQRWWPDPATELLLARHPRGERPAFKATLPLLQQLLLEQGVPGNLQPEKISEVLRSARIWWAARSAPVDLHSMMRTFASHNLTSRCWRRLVGRPAPRPPQPRSCWLTGSTSPESAWPPCRAARQIPSSSICCSTRNAPEMLPHENATPRPRHHIVGPANFIQPQFAATTRAQAPCSGLSWHATWVTSAAPASRTA